MSTITRMKNFVGGEWVDAAEGGTMEVINPATGETIAEVPRGTQADVDRAVEAAKKAYEEWRDTTPGERAEMLLKLADLIDAGLPIDRALSVLIEQSEDMQADALRGLDGNLDDLRDLRSDRRGQTAEPEEVEAALRRARGLIGVDIEPFREPPPA